jgi:nucleotide-binding universal stress UspA family protein
MPAAGREPILTRNLTAACQPRKESAMTTIVIATDGSPEAREAVEYGLDLAAEEHAHAVLLQVMPPVDRARLDRGGAVRPVADEIRLRDAPALEDAERHAAERGVDAKTAVVAGNPADEIVAYADSIGADMIVIGSRGSGAVAGALLGSVSRDVLYESRLPVVVVPSASRPAI